MSVEALTWAFKQPLNGWGSEKLVLLALADFMNEDTALCVPSFKKIARKASVSVATVNRAMKELCAWGLVEREHRIGTDGRQTSNFYRLRLDVMLAAAPTSSGVSVKPLGEGESKNESEAMAYEGGEVEGLQSDTPPSRSLKVPQSQSDTPPVSLAPLRRTVTEPELETSPQPPEGGRRVPDSDSESGPVARAVPTGDQFWAGWGAPPTASRKNFDRQWAKRSDSEKIQDYAAIEPYRRACEAENRKRCDPSTFISRGLSENFKAAGAVPPRPEPSTPHAAELQELYRQIARAPSTGERDWVFFAHGSAAWREWQKAFRLACLPPFHSKHYDARPLAGRPVALHGRYFPMAFPPTAPDALRLATGEELARLLTEPLGGADANESEGEGE